MIRCSKCGTINGADASFCSECNAYLEWSGEKVGGDTPAPEPGSARAEDAEPTPGQAPGETPDVAAPAARSATSAAAPRPSPPQPESRKPQRSPAAPKPKVVVPAKEDRPKPGDLICPDCGTGNDPQRKFCRRCGHSLTEAVVEPEPPPPPWYKRLFGRGGGAATYQAGSRPDDIGRRRRRPGCLLIFVLVLVIALVAAGLAYAFHDGTRDAVDDGMRTVRCRVLEQLAEPTQASIASPAGGEYGSLAFDGSDETTWRATRTNDQGAFVLEVQLDTPAFVHRLEVTPAEDEPRPRIVRVHDGGRILARKELSNDGETQAIDICRDLARFNIRLVTTYPQDANQAGIRRVVVRVQP